MESQDCVGQTADVKLYLNEDGSYNFLEYNHQAKALEVRRDRGHLWSRPWPRPSAEGSMLAQPLQLLLC